MSIWWLETLVVYGIVCGWEKIDPLFWFLLLPMLAKDWYDYQKSKRF